VAAKGANLPAVEQMSPAERRATEITQIQRDIARRRQRRLALLLTRLTAFVFLPTLIVGWYFAFIATPMFATKSEFIIQQAESGAAAGGLGGLFQGTSMATQQDSITVQSYLASRAAMIRLDGDHGFKDHFSMEGIDAIQRLEDGATNEAAFKIYNNKVKLSYDPTEGILRMEVIAANPETSQRFSEALIGYAEEQVDNLTQRLREDQMAGALASFEAAQKRRSDALDILSNLQAQSEVIDPVSESSALLSRVTNLEIERDSAMITLESLLDNTRPNQARVDAARALIDRLDTSISGLRSQMASTQVTSGSLSSVTAEMRKAEENYQTELLMLQQSQAQMESAQIEASRQVRYLSLGVEPVAPDEATYPRVFENTALAFLIFAGTYLMISLTASILREQVSS
jgi:capsular polysaccharide transport system permease protein